MSEIRSNNEFSSRETKTPAIRINAFLLFPRKRNNEMILLKHLNTLYQYCVMALSRIYNVI